MSTKGKIGRFLFFIGALALIIFFATVLDEDPLYSLFLVGLVITILGGILWSRGGRPPAQTGRFRVIRSAREKFAESRSQKQEAGKK